MRKRETDTEQLTAGNEKNKTTQTTEGEQSFSWAVGLTAVHQMTTTNFGKRISRIDFTATICHSHSLLWIATE